MTESIPGPETSRPAFLSHSVHHSTLSRGNHSDGFIAFCMGLQIKLPFEVEVEMEQRSGKV